MGRSADMKDPRVDKPAVYDSGFSELVPVFTTDGKLIAAQYGSDGWWHGEGNETFGNVANWVDHFQWPHGWAPDYSQYGGEP